MPNTPDEPRSERSLIRRLSSALDPQTPGAPGDAAHVRFGDDMALIDPADSSLLWTVDMLMDGVDFDSTQHDWELVGRKAMAVNLSDCAAMAARPVAALCALSLSTRLSMNDAERLVRGAHAMGRRFGCPIVGGDTNSWAAPTVISISVAGRLPAGIAPVTRSGAVPGDRIWLTGPCGGSILGRHLRFEPRVEVAIEIARTLAPHAMIDISDGIAIDLDRVCEASACGAEIDVAALDAAVHPDAHELTRRDGRPPREHALADGEDFELLVVLPADADPDAVRRCGLLPLGVITGERGLRLRHADGRIEPLAPTGWEHFR